MSVLLAAGYIESMQTATEDDVDMTIEKHQRALWIRYSQWRSNWVGKVQGPHSAGAPSFRQN